MFQYLKETYDHKIFRNVLIKDSLEKSGRPLLKSFLVSLFENNCDIECLCYDLPPKTFCEGLKESLLTSSRFNIHSGITEDFKWKKPVCLESSCEALIVDSFSACLMNQSVHSLCRDIHYGFQGDSDLDNVTGLLHSDTLPAKDVAILETFATMVIEIVPNSQLDKTLCNVRIQTKGKLQTEMLMCEISPSFEILSWNPYKPSSERDKKIVHKADPTSNLPFNLNLSEKEKLSRKEVLLPYANVCGDKKIDFSDENHFDEEEEDDDPDDDLDF